MKRIILLFICILLCASLAGCKLNSGSVDSSLSLVSDQNKTTIEQTSASSAPDTSEAAESSTEAKTPAGTAIPDTAADSKNEPAQTTPGTTSPAQGDPQGGGETKEPDAPKETVPPTPKETTSSPVPPKPETTAPTTETSTSETPTDPYAYPFNIEQIRNDCIVLGKSYGFALNESLTPVNASWAGAETASTNTQGSLLKRMLGEMIEYYTPAYRESIGLPEISISAFNIYCEQTGNGSYRIYFLFLL